MFKFRRSQKDWLDKPFSLSGRRVWVTGHTGMVGQALIKRLESEQCHVLTIGRTELDLRDQAAVQGWVRKNKPDVIFMAAAKGGGIKANIEQPAQFIYDNTMIQTNILHNAAEFGVRKVLFLGSSCMYPKNAKQPMKESDLLSGVPEPSNEAYALAKLSGLKMAQAYRAQYDTDIISAIPCNLYGPYDNFDLKTAHVIPALIHKVHQAQKGWSKSIKVWGDGTAKREFLYVDDLADALIFLMKNYSAIHPVNVGTGEEINIADLTQKICDIADFKGKIVFQDDEPSGVSRKVMDISVMEKAGWKAATSLDSGLRNTFEWFKKNTQNARKAA